MIRRFRSLVVIWGMLSWIAAVGWAGPSPDPAITPGKDLGPASDNALHRLVDWPRRAPPSNMDGGRTHGLRAMSNWPPAETEWPVDVTHYDLDLTFGLSDTSVSGTATITLVWGQASGNVLHLDLVGLTAGAVRKAQGGAYSFTQNASGLEITIVPPPSPEDVITVVVEYQGQPSLGFYVRSAASFTFAEPEDARAWFPCRDVPWDKATLTLHGRVPSGYTLVSNGYLESTSSQGGFTTYHWREDHPIATYLIAAAISNYSFVAAPSTVAPLGWYVYPGDVSHAAVAFQHVSAMMDFFDETLAPYPFDKYVMCEAPFGGGMEHQSATLMGQVIVTAGTFYEWITAHELAHQWFGDYVTLADWRHIWLNEGFASFYDAVWHEDFYGPAAFAQRMQAFENEVISWQTTGTDHPVLDPPPSLLFSPIEYEKAAWVLRMLRDLVGRPAFDTAVRNYLSAHAFGNATTEDFQAAVEAQYGESLDWYFDQWVVTGTGRPQLIYAPVPVHTASGWLAQVDIRQVQEVPTTFRLPVEVRVTLQSGDQTFTGWIEDRHDVLAFPVPTEPLAVVVDPLNKILGEVTVGSTTGLVEGTPSAGVRLSPNPFRGSIRLETSPVPDSRAAEIFDVLGRKVREIALAPGQGEATWDGRDAAGRSLPAGAYFVRLGARGTAVRIIRLEGN